MTGFRLRLALFLGLIVGPAGVLTFLSLRAALDEQRSAMADLRLRIPSLRAAVDARLRAVLDALPADGAAADAAAAASLSEVRFVFALDATGAFVRPPALTPALVERSHRFGAALARGEALELGADDAVAAAAAYRQALGETATAGERAEALNALGRAALAAGDTAGAFDAHRRLGGLAAVLDADGAHPLTLSTMRLARYLAEAGEAERAVALVETWSRGVLAGDIPFHPGAHLAVDRLAPIARTVRHRVGDDGRLDSLLADLGRIARRADFIAAYDHLLETAVVRPEATYLCGVDPAGESLLAVVRPVAAGGAAATGGAIGAVVDLDALADDLLDGPAGQPLAAAGFGLALFDADATADFGRRYGDGAKLVAPAHRLVYRLNLGVVARDEPFVFAHYRNRGALWVGGITFLAGAIGLGVWVLLRETAREVETARLRAEFVANVSHELRTPLTAIRMYAESLLEDRVRTPEQRRDYLTTMMRESQRLSRMVGNILDVSRLESGRKTFQLTDTDIGAVVRAVLAEFEPLLSEQGFAVDVDIAAGLPLVPADGEALESAVANLVGNAVKYSVEQRQLSVRVGAEAQQLCIEVADRGVGIPEAQRRAVFEKYRRASNAAGVATGAGLGLALVAGVARGHGGSVEAVARAGGGTRFRLTLPLKG